MFFFYYETKLLFPTSQQYYQLINLRLKLFFIQEGNYHDSIPEQKPPSQSKTLAPTAPSTQPTHEQLSDDSRLEKQTSPNKVETSLPTPGNQTVPKESASSSETHSQSTLKQQGSPQHQTEVAPTSNESANKTSTSEGSSSNVSQDASQTSSVAKASSPPPPSHLPTPSQGSKDKISLPAKPPATDTSNGLTTQGKIAQTISTI